MNLKQCDLATECDLSTIQELIFSSSEKKLCRDFYLSRLSKPDFAAETGVTAQASENTDARERGCSTTEQFSLGGLNCQYRATTDRASCIHQALKYRTWSRKQTQYSSTDSALFRTYSCCLISLLPRLTCFVYLSLQTRHHSVCIKSQPAF